jgi:hypothetical protein
MAINTGFESLVIILHEVGLVLYRNLCEEWAYNPIRNEGIDIYEGDWICLKWSFYESLIYP